MSQEILEKVGRLVDLLAEVAAKGLSGRIGLPVPEGASPAWVEFTAGRLCAFEGARPEGEDDSPGALLKRLSDWLVEAASAGTSHLVAGEGPGRHSGGDRNLELTAADLVIGVLRKVQDDRWLRARALPDGDRKLKAGGACPAPPGIALGSEEGFLVSRLDGTMSGGQIVSLSPHGERRTLQALAALRAVGMLTDAGTTVAPDSTLAELEAFLDTTAVNLPATTVDYTPEQRAERDELFERIRSFAGLDHYAILGVGRKADEQEIRRSYYHLARLYHPDRLHRPHLEDMERSLEEMFASITEAYNTLQDTKARAEYDGNLASRSGGRRNDSGQDKQALARDAYLRGKKHLEAGETFEALQLFESAVQNDPQRPEYLHYLARCQGENPRWRKRAEENLLKAIELNPAQTASYLELARLYKKGKLERRSLAMYEKVLEWDPVNKEARAAIEQSKEGPSGGSGFLGSIFKKD